MRSLLKNCRIISPGFDPEQCMDIFMVAGTIVKIAENITEEYDRTVDAGGNYVLPGLIDMHCNICDPGYEYIEDIETASKSAVKGGFTTITCEPNTKPAIDNKTVVEYIVSKCNTYALINIYPYGSMSVNCQGKDMAEIGEMYEAGIVGVSDGSTYIENTAFLRNVFRYSKMFGMPVISHCNDKFLSGKGVMNDGFISASLGLEGIPRESEEVIVARNIILAEGAGSKLHIAQVSTKGAVQLIREAKSRSNTITCATCPHYFMLTEDAVGNYNTFAKVMPPLRTQEDVDAIIEGIADGTIDVIASGHSPTKMTDKNKEFDNAAYGISSFETAFSTSYTRLVETGIITLPRLMEVMSQKPAEILRLSKKGRIAEGMDGDLIVINIKDSYTIDAATFASKAKFSPFQNFNVKGKILFTIVGGRMI